MASRDPDILARKLAAHTVVDESCCHIWTGKVGNRGYGQISFWDGRPMNKLVHRLSYEVHVGPIPAGLFVLHTCDVPLCVNPAHLRVGTLCENTRDAMSKGRMRWAKGRRGVLPLAAALALTGTTA